VAHVAGLHELGDGAHRLFDRHLRIDAPEPVDVDVVGAEAGQGVGERVLDRLRRPSMPRISPPGPRSTPNLTLSTNSSRLRPRRASRSRSSFSPRGVVVGRVEERDSRIERGVNRRDALHLVGRAIERRHPHAARAPRRPARSNRACEDARDHSPRSCPRPAASPRTWAERAQACGSSEPTMRGRLPQTSDSPTLWRLSAKHREPSVWSTGRAPADELACVGFMVARRSLS
jgi:hypothetical protein